MARLVEVADPADARLSDAAAPYTRLTESEQERLRGAEARAADLGARIEQLRSAVAALGQASAKPAMGGAP